MPASSRIAVEVTPRDAILPLVIAGAGASLLPGPLTVAAAAQGAVVTPVRPRVHRDIGLVHRVGPLSPAARAFLAVVEGSGAASGSW